MGPPGDSSGAVSGRSEPWRRTANPPSAQRESSSSSEPTQRAEDRSRGPKRTAEREWSAASLGGKQQIPKSAQRESSSSSEPTQRAQDRSRGAPPPRPPAEMPSRPCLGTGWGMRRSQNVQRSGNGPQRALEANSKSPKALSAKALPPQSLLSERRPDAAQPIEGHQYSMQCPLLCK